MKETIIPINISKKDYDDFIDKINNDSDDINLNFILENFNIKIYLMDKELYFEISLHKYLIHYNMLLLNDILVNLPNNTDYLIFNFDLPNYDIFDIKFKNLPLNLKKIKFNYSINQEWYGEYEKFCYIKAFGREGIFNCLFNCKIPFNCELLINVIVLDEKKEYNYKVLCIDNLINELTLLLINDDNKSINVSYSYEKYVPFNSTYINILRVFSGMAGLSYSN